MIKTMKNSYLAPQIEVIEIEIEDAVLSSSVPSSLEEILQGAEW